MAPALVMQEYAPPPAARQEGICPGCKRPGQTPWQSAGETTNDRYAPSITRACLPVNPGFTPANSPLA